MKDEKKVPLGVWIFWALVGLLIIIRLVPWPKDAGNTLGLIINLFSALGAVSAASVVYLTVLELRNQRKEDRTNLRPYFSFVEGEMGTVPDDESHYGYSPYIEIKLKQVGKNPAKDLTATSTILMPADNGHAVEVYSSRSQ
ncbi:MAG: hypothetical protein AABN95_03315 [Acidobacteriota bacterium]